MRCISANGRASQSGFEGPLRGRDCGSTDGPPCGIEPPDSSDVAVGKWMARPGLVRGQSEPSVSGVVLLDEDSRARVDGWTANIVARAAPPGNDVVWDERDELGAMGGDHDAPELPLIAHLLHLISPVRPPDECQWDGRPHRPRIHRRCFGARRTWCR